MHGIGQAARESGLSVSALRFYDAAGIIVPAGVDPHSGYRRYGREEIRAARLVARLRRIGMPLADVRRVLDDRDDRGAVDAVLDKHLARLEAGLADARRELRHARALLDEQETPVTTDRPTSCQTPGAELAAALRAVRYAVSADPDLPMLGGVLLELGHDELGPDELGLAATDRYRLAVATAPVTDLCGPPGRVLAPVHFVDELIAALTDDPAPVTLLLLGDRIVLRTVGGELGADRLRHDFPDHRRLLGSRARHRIPVQTREFRRELLRAPQRTVVREDVSHEVTVLTLDDTGLLNFDAADGGVLTVGVNREFLLQALDATEADQLVLELDGTITPLAIRDPLATGRLGLVMPVRL